MKPLSNQLKTLAAMGQETTYADLKRETGIQIPLLTSCIAVLKRRGWVARVNDTAPKRDIAIFRITTSGLNALHPEGPPAEPGETTVNRAIRTRPALATCWTSPIPDCDGVDECYFVAAGQLAHAQSEGSASHGR